MWRRFQIGRNLLSSEMCLKFQSDACRFRFRNFQFMSINNIFLLSLRNI